LLLVLLSSEDKFNSLHVLFIELQLPVCLGGMILSVLHDDSFEISCLIVADGSKSSDHDLFNESEYHDENVNTDISSDFCGCGTMCGYKRPLISVSNSEMANMSSATIRHDSLV
jgi:hypothetical protein